MAAHAVDAVTWLVWCLALLPHGTVVRCVTLGSSWGLDFGTGILVSPTGHKYACVSVYLALVWRCDQGADPAFTLCVLELMTPFSRKQVMERSEL